MMSTLEAELEQARRLVSTDGYPMSVGELTSMYRDEELIIRPPFQRLFRWNGEQKSRLIESILIGIPLPSVFVAQDEEGRWELIDGLQRISTLLQLQGLLDDERFPPLKLSGTKYLPALEGMVWDSDDDADPALTPAQRRDIKRSKIDLKIIQRESDTKTKFDLFQRLNSFGSKLSNQEIRNAQLVGVSPQFVEWLYSLAIYDPFATLLQLPEAELQRKYDEELVLRFLYLYKKTDEELRGIRSFQDGLNDFAVDLAMNFTDEYKNESEAVFKQTFDLLSAADESIFGRWRADKGDFKGGFLNTSFEVFAIGLGHLLYREVEVRTDLRDCAIEFWKKPEMTSRFATGKSTESRLKLLAPMGREILKA